MNGSKNIRSGKRLAWMAVLSGAMVMTFSLAAFGQQEVDPTWYDPWMPNTTVIQSAQLAVVQTAVNTAGHTTEAMAGAAAVEHQAKDKSVSSTSSSSSSSTSTSLTKRAAKTSAKRSANQRSADQGSVNQGNAL
ncbi:MAG: hypothetical protein ACLPN2_19685 [Terriglobales bacterium]